ncbi:ankyrin repeat-containing protein [Anaeramoeba flamelloides]|uniref:Ankyrin repeat-containing protein n=1 Tax=Anaeramoeba flamelloides TaxID=1746091 RepID=A0AAV8ABG8_9EUKA|nr:ankyrin repeat-containing protein [Anaeramoeba flamelloides]
MSENFDLNLLIKFGKFDEIKELVANSKIKVDQKVPKTAYTVLQMSILRKQPEIALYFLEKGSDPNLRGPQERTALHFSCLKGQPEVTNLLLEKGADVNAQDKSGLSAAHALVLCKKNRRECLRILKKFNINFDLKDMKNRTPLEMSIFSGEKEATFDLIQMGVNVDLNTLGTFVHVTKIEGKTVLVYALDDTSQGVPKEEADQIFVTESETQVSSRGKISKEIIFETRESRSKNKEYQQLKDLQRSVSKPRKARTKITHKN